MFIVIKGEAAVGGSPLFAIMQRRFVQADALKFFERTPIDNFNWFHAKGPIKEMLSFTHFAWRARLTTCSLEGTMLSQMFFSAGRSDG